MGMVMDHRHRLRLRAVVWSAAMALGLGGCERSFASGDSAEQGFTDAGEALIEGELADQIGLGALDATCSGANLSAGTTFRCTARTVGLGPIEFIGTVNDTGDGVNITSTNLLLAAQVEQVEAFAAALIEDQTSTPIGPEDFECADTSLVVSSGDTIDCVVTDPVDGTVYSAPVTIEDLAQLSIIVNVGDPIG